LHSNPLKYSHIPLSNEQKKAEAEAARKALTEKKKLDAEKRKAEAGWI